MKRMIEAIEYTGWYRRGEWLVFWDAHKGCYSVMGPIGRIYREGTAEEVWSYIRRK